MNDPSEPDGARQRQTQSQSLNLPAAEPFVFGLVFFVMTTAIILVVELFRYYPDDVPTAKLVQFLLLATVIAIGFGVGVGALAFALSRWIHRKKDGRS